MHIKVQSSGQTALHRVILIAKPEQLENLKLNQAEQHYALKHIKNGSPLLINRYESFLHLVQVEPQDHDYKTAEALRRAGNMLVSTLLELGSESLMVGSADEALSPLHFAEGLSLGSYQFLKYFSDADARKHPLREIYLEGPTEQEVQHLQACVNGTSKARDLVNEPLSFLTAEQLAAEAARVGKENGLSVEIMAQKKIESLKMGGLLAVNRGSEDPATFTVLEHKPKGAVNKRPIVLVGKGVVYDTGGMSLKSTANSMDKMKSDMGGAAAVIGAMAAAGEANLPVHLIALIPATDNRPGKNAYVPGDVITMYDGTTVEVMNTDAEGRLLLADALAYAQKYDPELVIDLATLTGAAAVAIGKFGLVGMGTASTPVLDALDVAGQQSYERLAQFPLWEEYRELLKSPVADLKNVGGREGGAITAGKFLEHFTDYPWVHLDIAGPAFLNSAYHYLPVGGTGVGVRILFEYLKAQS